MAEGTAITNVVTKPASALMDFAKKYWIFAIVLLLIIIALVIRWRDSLVKKGQSAPALLRSFMKISGFLLPIGFVLFGADVVQAATAGATCCAIDSGRSLFDQIWQYILALGSGGVMLGITAFTAPDTLDLVTSNEGRELNYTPGSAQEFSLYAKTSTKCISKGGAPLVAVDTTIALDTTVEQVAAGTSGIQDDDLARLLDYLEMESPLLGTVVGQTTATGPVLDLVISFLGQGFNRAGNAPIDSITVPAVNPNDVALTKYFTFPWAQRYLKDPAATCPWLRLLHNTNHKIKIAASTALAAVSTGANSKSASKLRGAISYIPHQFWFQPLLPYWRVDKPSSGSDGLTFKNFGGEGPSSTVPVDYVHTIGQLSNLKGLPGNLTFEKVTKIIAASFGMDDVLNVDMLVKARLQAQVSGRTPDISYANGGNHAMGTTNEGMALDELLFLLLRQPSLDMIVDNMLAFDKTTELPIREEFSAARTGEDAFIIGSLRALSVQRQLDFSKLPLSKLPGPGQKPRHFKAA